MDQYMYAVELYLSDSINDFIKRKWQELADTGISSYMNGIEGMNPHITLIPYEKIIDLDRYMEEFKSYFYKLRMDLSLKFDTVGIFPVTGSVFLQPKVTEELLKLHRDFLYRFEEFSEFANSLYLPESWNPHCSIAGRVSEDQMGKVIENINRGFTPLISKVSEVVLVKLTKRDGVCIKSEDLVRIGIGRE